MELIHSFKINIKRENIMAIQEKKTHDKNMKNGKQLADAWLNLTVVDNNGKSHNLTGVPMYRDHYLTEAFIEKSGVEVGGQADIELTIEGTITLVDHNPEPVTF
jgi:hypothetical protein